MYPNDNQPPGPPYPPPSHQPQYPPNPGQFQPYSQPGHHQPAGSEPPWGPPKKKGRRRILIAIGVLVVCGIIVAAILVATTKSGSNAHSNALTDSHGTATVPSARNTLPDTAIWDPATIPDSLMQSFKLETPPGSCDTHSGIRSCNWGSSLDLRNQPQPVDWGFFAYSSRITFDETQHYPGFHDFTPVTVHGRPALQYEFKNYTLTQQCNLVWGTPYGSVWTTLDVMTGNIDACDTLQKISDAIYPLTMKGTN